MTLPYLFDPAELLPRIQLYRDALAVAGHDPSSREVLGKFHIYVADSAAAARNEAGPYLANYYDVAKAHRDGQLEGVESLRSFDTQLARGSIIAGNPAHCISAIRTWVDRLGLTAISGTFHFGGMPQELAIANIRRFARDVMPAFPPSRG
jgi:alkanesulfonate monooxygenase SsuD/methylene tetrahydromethanopterin reductase-like flavin-dependent oxidoreductase (luciferase family)